MGEYFSSCLVSAFLFCFLLAYFPSPSTGGPPSGAFCPSDPAPWKGRETLLWRARTRLSGAPPAEESPVLGYRRPSRKFCPRKNGTPRSGLLETTQRSSRLLSFRLTASTIRSSGSPLSLFSRGHSPVPPQSTSGFPQPEKNPKTHGVLASQDSVPQGRSQGRA